ncbi:MAG: PQQ-binding-like beta-propeller repeat protein [Acidobacteriota bacterium]
MPILSACLLPVALSGLAPVTSPVAAAEGRGATSLTSVWTYPIEGTVRLHRDPLWGGDNTEAIVIEAEEKILLLGTGGEQRWSLEVHAGVEWLRVEPSYLLVSDGNAELHAIDTTNGKIVWSHPAQADLWTAVAHGDHWLVVDDRSLLRGHRLESGQIAWDRLLDPIRNKWLLSVYFAPIPDDGDVLLIEEAHLSRLNSEDGKVSWRVELPTAARSGALLRDGRVILPAARSLVAYDLAGGERLWGHDLGAASYFATLVPGQEKLVAATETDRLVGIDLASGRRLWEVEISIALNRLFSRRGQTSSGSVAYVESSRKLWRSRKPWKRANAPLLLADEKNAYVISSAFSLQAFDVNNGRVRWRVPLSSGRSRLVLSGNSLCAGSWWEDPQCIDPESGKVRWKSDFGEAQIRDLGDGILLAWGDEHLRVIEADTGRLLRHAEFEDSPRDLLILSDLRLIVVALPNTVEAYRW